jgi:hypothetical protein
MQVSFALFADAANLSQEGKLNVLGVFDAVHAASFPSIHPRATLVVRLKGSPADAGTHTMGLRWHNPAGTELWSSSAELTVGVPPAGHSPELDMPVIAAVDLPLDMPGDYRMLVDLDGTARTDVTLHVHGPVGGGRPMPGLVS